MDTISRENTSMLPVAGVVVGVLSLLIGGYAAIKASSLQKTVTAHEEKIQKIDGIESGLAAANDKADKATANIASLKQSTQDAFNTVSTMIGDANAKITKLEDCMKKPAATAKKGAKGEPAVAGPGEYLVKKGDSGAKIARENGVSLEDLKSVNPEVNWTKLHVGQKVKLPQKK